MLDSNRYILFGTTIYQRWEGCKYTRKLIRIYTRTTLRRGSFVHAARIATTRESETSILSCKSRWKQRLVMVHVKFLQSFTDESRYTRAGDVKFNGHCFGKVDWTDVDVLTCFPYHTEESDSFLEVVVGHPQWSCWRVKFFKLCTSLYNESK